MTFLAGVASVVIIIVVVMLLPVWLMFGGPFLTASGMCSRKNDKREKMR